MAANGGRRVAASFLDWVLVGVVVAAIGQLFGSAIPRFLWPPGEFGRPAGG